MKRARLHALSFSRVLACLRPSTRPRRDDRPAHRRRLFPRVRPQVKPGWQLAGRSLCACRNGQPTAASANARARRAVRGRAGPAEPPELRGRGYLFRLVEDASRPERDRASSLRRPEQMGFAAARDALFAGEIVNPSEGRPATHVAERGSGAPRRRRSRDRAAAAHARAGRRDRGRRVRRHHRHSSYRHRRIGARAGAAGRCARAAVVEARCALPVEHRWRGVRRCRETARSRDDAGRGRIEDLHDAGNAGQFRGRTRLAARRGVSRTRMGASSR